jgi:hypothetical protein
VHPDASCTGGTAVELLFTPDEFIHSFKEVFVMSDGSVAGNNSIPSAMELTSYAQLLMHNVGVNSSTSPTRSHVCTSSLMNLYMLAAVGNFATHGDEAMINSLPSVVVDAYTGKLATLRSYADTRTIFLETLLVVCIIAIARIYIFLL